MCGSVSDPKLSRQSKKSVKFWKSKSPCPALVSGRILRSFCGFDPVAAGRLVACFWNHDGCFLALDLLGFFKTISSCSKSTSETVDSSSAMTSVGFGSGGQSSSTSGFWPTPRRPKRSQRSMATVSERTAPNRSLSDHFLRIKPKTKSCPSPSALCFLG